MHEGHRARMKKRFLREGLSSFADHEILEFLLYFSIPQGDTNPLAHHLLDKFKTVDAVFEASIQELCSVKGIGAHTATLIKLIPELSRFYLSLSARDKNKLVSMQETGDYICKRIGGLSKEVFAVLCLDAQKQVLAFDILEEGTVTTANIYPRKVIEYAIRHNASSVVFAHNHPSSVNKASDEDISITRKLCILFESADIDVIDHIIVLGTDDFMSMSQNGYMDIKY